MESENYTNKIVLFEKSHKKLLDHCNDLERTLVLFNQGLKILKTENLTGQKDNGEIEVQDIQTSDEINSNKGNKALR